MRENAAAAAIDTPVTAANTVLAATVATPIEQEVNGVEDLLYMESVCTNDGQLKLTVTFGLGTDLDEAQVQVIAATLRKNGIDGVIATNTTIAREAVKHLPHGEETGGLSGGPLRERGTRLIDRDAGHCGRNRQSQGRTE